MGCLFLVSTAKQGSFAAFYKNHTILKFMDSMKVTAADVVI
jgi:hypothetical protein